MLTYTFHHVPMPAVRVTGKALWLPRAQAYGAYKAELARCLAKAHPELIIPPRPPKVTKRVDAVGWQSRKDWDVKYKSKTYYLDVEFTAPSSVSDFDNLTKSVMDAIQLSGIVPNDCMIKTGWPATFSVGEPSTFIVLVELPAETTWRKAREQSKALFLKLIKGKTHGT